MVQLARHVWASAGKSSTRGSPGAEVIPPDVLAAMDDFVREQGALYQRIWLTCDATGQEILRVFAAEPAVEITAATTLTRYRLKAKSTVHRIVGELLRQELLAADDHGRSMYDDPFFRRWVQLFALDDMGIPTPPLLEPHAAR